MFYCLLDYGKDAIILVIRLIVCLFINCMSFFRQGGNVLGSICFVCFFCLSAGLGDKKHTRLTFIKIGGRV